MNAEWKQTNTFDDINSISEHIGIIELLDNNGEWHDFSIVRLGQYLYFGGVCNVGFFESGYIVMKEDETIDSALHELYCDLRDCYNSGYPFRDSRIVCNERM